MYLAFRRGQCAARAGPAKRPAGSTCLGITPRSISTRTISTIADGKPILSSTFPREWHPASTAFCTVATSRYHTGLCAATGGYRDGANRFSGLDLHLSGLWQPSAQKCRRRLSRAAGGAVFSTGSISFCGSLSGNNYDNTFLACLRTCCGGLPATATKLVTSAAAVRGTTRP